MTGIEFGVGFGGAGGAQPLIEDVYRICVMGDFGGQATGRLVEVDRDNIDQIMAAMKVTAAGLELRGLDDFHPDHLLTRIVVPAETEPPAPPIQPPSVLAPGGLLDAIVGEESLRQAAKSEAERMVDRLVAEAAATAQPVKPDDAKPGAATAMALRKVLHDARFQAVEAAWRSLAFLVNRLETGPRLKVFMLDLPPAQFVADLQSGKLEKLLVEGKATTWSTWLALWRFPAEPGPAALLARLAKLAAAADVTLLASGDTALAGCRSIAETPDPDDWSTITLSEETAAAWAALMRLPEAAHLGLVVPRVLLRLPYGRDSDPIDRFAFEEFTDAPAHSQLLWGSGAIAAAVMLAGDKNDPEIGNLPLYIRKDPLGAEAMPPTEAALSVRAASALAEVGLMPLLWIQHTDRARLGGWRGLTGSLSGRGARS